MKRIAILEQEKIKDKNEWFRIQSAACPVNRMGTECIIQHEDGTVAIDESTCVGCGICVKKCMYKATHIVNLPEELKSTPIHRYGENEFVLYSLPTPSLSRVSGLLGVNGIGKSTAIKIVAGVVKPNLGDWSNEHIDFQEVINQFKGSEAQQFFEDLNNKKITVSYKPQQVELIPKSTNGTVKDLLTKVDEKNEFENVVKELQLSNFLDHDIKDLSGGELQRVAIAATVLKKAHLYIFDEPTSFLDIKQRVNVSKFIRSLVSEETGVLLIEHDLIILDYMTDVLNIMYGKESAYGVVSSVKPTKAGINVFLSGYLKEENVRFRKNEIKFEAKPPVEGKGREVLTSWKNLTKKQGEFAINAGDGEIYRKDVIGILGENGTGKTTFVKMLAGVLKSDEGEITEEVSVSYKPQYIEPKEDTVYEVLQTAVQKYEHLLINSLGLQPLLEKQMNTLSGGELQRVAIAQCLQEDAQLYLLDEPSAYLDAEQRLLVSKVLRDFMEQKGATALVVDHDLLFVDYVSNRLLVFDGVPAKQGKVNGPFDMQAGMNYFLKDLGITLRKDPENNRPRINKLNSHLDREQKSKGNYYYSG